MVRAECPLDCHVAVNAPYRADVERRARELVTDYESSGQSCAYRCIGAVPACAAGRCEAVNQ